MKNEIIIDDLWNTIESKHNAETNRFGSSYALTLENGQTFIYNTLPDGKLLSIEEWFDGYVSILGSAESGLHYAVKYEGCKICLYEYSNSTLNTKPTVTIQSKKTEIAILKTMTTVCPPVRIIHDYVFQGIRYWVIESCGKDIIVFNLTEQKVHEKCKYAFDRQSLNCAVVYRFSVAPYRFGLVTDYLPYRYEAGYHFHLIDFLSNKTVQLNNLSTRCIQIYDHGNRAYSAYAMKKHQFFNSFGFNSDCNKIRVGHFLANRARVKLNNTTVINGTRELDYHPDIPGSTDKYSVFVPDDAYMNEDVIGSYTLSGISNSTENNICIVKEFIEFLQLCYESGNKMQIDYTPALLKSFGDACNETDSRRLQIFVDSVYSRLRSQKYFIEESKMKIEFTVQQFSCGKLIYRKVYNCPETSTRRNFRNDKINVGFYKDCKFEVSITLSYYYSNKEALKAEEEYFNNVYDGEKEHGQQSFNDEVTLENMFDDDFCESDYEEDQAENDINQYKSPYYRLTLPSDVYERIEASIRRKVAKDGVQTDKQP